MHTIEIPQVLMQTATSMYSQCYVAAAAKNVLTEHIYNVEVSTVETD
jgi:hypothetical protein